MYNILLVEDNKDIQELNKNLLETVGYNVYLAMNLASARQSINELAPDIIVLDIMLPDGNGLDFLGELRQSNNDTPVLLLTALGTTDEKVAGLRAGGDDYLAKPYDYNELLARIESLTRRIRKVTHGSITINYDTRRVYSSGQDLQLNRIEYALLLKLVRNEGQTINSEELYNSAWEQPMNDNASALHAQISNLRKKLHGSGCSITAKRGRGYIFEKE